MESNSIISQIKSKYILDKIFSYINSDNYKFILLFYSKVSQKKCGIGINDYKIKYIENINKLKNTKEFLEKIQKYDKLNLIKIQSKNFFLVNSINNFFNPIPYYWEAIYVNGRILPELNNLKKNFLDNEGFQIYGIKENKLIGVIEGPPETSYENGFFIFEIIISKNYPFKFGEFYFKTKIFHPNISEDGLVS